MNIRKLLTKDSISLRLQAKTKEEAITELIDLLDASGKVENRKLAEKAIWEREKKMSTGMQNGVAIPHGKSDTVSTLAVAVGIKPEGIPFDSLDQKPAIFFIMTLSPTNRTGPHIQFLAEISRQLNDPAVRERMLNADSREAIIDILAGA